MNEDPRNFESSNCDHHAFWRSMSAVFWSFFGVRKSSDHEEDASNLSLLHVVLAGLFGATLFVLMLILIIRVVID